MGSMQKEQHHWMLMPQSHNMVPGLQNNAMTGDNYFKRRWPTHRFFLRHMQPPTNAANRNTTPTAMPAIAPTDRPSPPADPVKTET